MTVLPFFCEAGAKRDMAKMFLDAPGMIAVALLYVCIEPHRPSPSASSVFSAVAFGINILAWAAIFRGIDSRDARAWS